MYVFGSEHGATISSVRDTIYKRVNCSPEAETSVSQVDTHLMVLLKIQLIIQTQNINYSNIFLIVIFPARV
jgi:hypothetical protein